MNVASIDLVRTVYSYLDAKDLCRIACLNHFFNHTSIESKQWIFLFFKNQNNFSHETKSITILNAKKACKQLYIKNIKQLELGFNIAKYISLEMQNLNYGDSIRFDIILFDETKHSDRIRIDYLTPIFFLGKGLYHHKITAINTKYSLLEDKISKDLFSSNSKVTKYSGRFLFDHYTIYIKTGLKKLPNQEAIECALGKQVERLKKQAMIHSCMMVAFFITTISGFVFFNRDYWI